MKRYEVIQDLQGGSFGMGRQYTALEWLEQSCEWQGDDGMGGADIRRYKEYWTKQIAAGRERDLIGDIEANWEIVLQEV